METESGCRTEAVLLAGVCPRIVSGRVCVDLVTPGSPGQVEPQASRTQGDLLMVMSQRLLSAGSLPPSGVRPVLFPLTAVWEARIGFPRHRLSQGEETAWCHGPGGAGQLWHPCTEGLLGAAGARAAAFTWVDMLHSRGLFSSCLPLFRPFPASALLPSLSSLTFHPGCSSLKASPATLLSSPPRHGRSGCGEQASGSSENQTG